MKGRKKKKSKMSKLLKLVFAGMFLFTNWDKSEQKIFFKKK